MRRFYFIICFVFFSAQPVLGQAIFEVNLDGFNSREIVLAQGDSTVNFMSEQEKAVVFYMNLVRLEPQIFLETILRPYVAHHDLNVNHYVKSLFNDLKKAKPVATLQMRNDLYLVARNHMLDIGPKGLEGHNGSGGATFNKRMAPLFKTYASVSENVGLGFESTLDNVMGLLIDDGVKNVGHRKAILSNDYKYIGVALGAHKTFKWGCVMGFGNMESP